MEGIREGKTARDENGCKLSIGRDVRIEREVSFGVEIFRDRFDDEWRWHFQGSGFAELLIFHLEVLIRLEYDGCVRFIGYFTMDYSYSRLLTSMVFVCRC